jgi:hypothetical protein
VTTGEITYGAATTTGAPAPTGPSTLFVNSKPLPNTPVL